MNTTELPVRPDVASFVTRVRALLADLSHEDQQELTEGLEADLGDLVDERGPQALGDPEAYARELRVAAGFEPVGRRRVRWGDVSSTRVFDRSRSWWERLMGSRPALTALWSVLPRMAPVW